jgi:hypothetical protein
MNRFKAPMASIIVLLLTITAVSLLVGLPYAAADEDTLFFDLAPDAQASENMAQAGGVVQTKWVEINWHALENPQTSEITINLFDGESVTAVHDRTDPSTSAGGYVWVGHIEGDPYSSVTLSVVDDVLAGSISPGGIEQYTIRYQNGRQVVQEIDPGSRIEMEGPDVIPAPAVSAQSENEATYCEDGSRVDLLVAYSTSARVFEGGTAAIEALINKRVADMNTANINSGLSFNFRLVHVMETDYEDTGNILVDLQRLVATDDDYMKDIIDAREQHLADMVSLIIGQSASLDACGIAYRMTNLSTADSETAFNVSALDYVGSPTCSEFTMAHEFGHNMGNHHDRANASGSVVLPYAYGFQSLNHTFRTIMAYQCSGTGCPRINYWSNPDVNFLGEPTGIDHDVDPGNSADNARSMAQTAYYAANFRENCESPTTPTHTPTPTFTSTPTHTPMPTVEPTASPGITVTATTVTSTPVPITPSPELIYHIVIPLILNLDG